MARLPGRVALALVGAVVLAACRQSDPPTASPAGSVPGAQTEATPQVSAPTAPVSKLVVAARKRLMADRAVARNKRGYEQATERIERDLAATSLARLVPASLAPTDILRRRLASVGSSLGVGVAGVVRSDRQPANVVVPAKHAGPGPYEYLPDQLIIKTALVVTLEPEADTARLDELVRAVSLGPGPLLLVSGHEGLSVNVLAHTRASVTPPVHTLEPMTPGSLAIAEGLAPPAPGTDLTRLSPILAEHAALGADLAAAMAALGASHLAGAQLAAIAALAQELGLTGRAHP